MSTPARRDLVFTRGDDWVHRVTFTTDGTTPIDVSARTYLAQLRSSADGELVATFDVDMAAAASGVVVLSLAAAATAALHAKAYAWDLQETAAGKKTTIIAGTVTNRADVSRA